MRGQFLHNGSSGKVVFDRYRNQLDTFTDSEGEFMGYFSVKDYREATRKLEAHQLLSARLSRSRKAISKRSEEKDESGGDLLDLLLGDNLEEEDEHDVPSMISLD